MAVFFTVTANGARVSTVEAIGFAMTSRFSYVQPMLEETCAANDTRLRQQNAGVWRMASSGIEHLFCTAMVNRQKGNAIRDYLLRSSILTLLTSLGNAPLFVHCLLVLVCASNRWRSRGPSC